MAITSHDIVPDSPTNNFCTLNPLKRNILTFSEGNLKASGQQYYTKCATCSMTMPVNSGKYYWELVFTRTSSTDGSVDVGIASTEFNPGEATGFPSVYPGQTSDSWGVAGNDGTKRNNATIVSYGSSFNSGDIIMVAYDSDNGSFFVGKNGTWFNSGDPSANTNYAYTGISIEVLPVIALAYDSGSSIGNINFGQDPTFGGNKNTPATVNGVTGPFAPSGTAAGTAGLFYYPPPAGAKALCTANLPDFTPTVTGDVPQDYFKAVTYSGSIGNDQLVDCGFPADFIWIKGRTASFNTAPLLYDTLRGRASVLQSYSTDDELDYGNLAPTFSTASNSINGFKTPSVTNNNINESGSTYVTWFWRAGGSPSASDDGTGVSGSAKLVDTSGAASSTTCKSFKDAAVTAGASNVICPIKMSINQAAGFSIVRYTGNGSIPHGLSSPLDLLIVKVINLDGESWGVWHSSFSSGDYIYLNSPNQKYNNNSKFSGIPSSTVFQVGADNTTGGSSYNYIAYCWHSVEGYSKFGSYTGNGDPDGPFVYCGFRPAWVMIKKTDGAATWWIVDSSRDEYNPTKKYLQADSANAENAGGSDYVTADFVSNGFKIRNTDTSFNSGNHIFMAFAEQPFKFSNAR